MPDARREIDSLRSLRSAVEAREFALAGQVASSAPRPAQLAVPGAEHLVDLGGGGCPSVPEFIALELVALLWVTHTSARALIADALSVRHRHPCLWRAVMGGVLPVWQVRKIAQAVRWVRLDLVGALRVDRCTAPALGAVSWPRLAALVEGEIVAADPQRAAEAEERARQGAFARGCPQGAGCRQGAYPHGAGEDHRCPQPGEPPSASWLLPWHAKATRTALTSDGAKALRILATQQPYEVVPWGTHAPGPARRPRPY